MDRIQVTSSDLRSVGYEEETQTLEIEFNSGSVYRYANVPPHEYEGLINASSKGKYFHANIKNAYSCTKL